ncbi:tetratricopeptide repeat protein [uncultured Nostoc sp.]|uniref:tetratricopeptide repeat protein n=1 Tax=uncultured Nostoc sp. TaxID=340711 RepID=UPI0035CC05C9
MSESSAFARVFNLGVDLLQKGDKQGAIMAWNEALSLNHNNSHAYYYRGVTKAEIGDYNGAVEDLNQALRITPQYLNAKRKLEKIYQDLSPDVFTPQANDHLTRYRRGIFRLQFQEYEEAIKEFNQSLHISHDFAPAYYNRGKSFHKLKKNDEAAKDFQIAAKLFCENGQSEKLAVWNPFELGESKREEAISYLITYLSRTSSYDDKRLAASAIRKLAINFKTVPDLAINLLLDNLTHPAPQVRQYVLKALTVINLPSYVIPNIEEIAKNDPKVYNRKIAEDMLQKLKPVSHKRFQNHNKYEPDHIHSVKEADVDSEEFSHSWNQEYFYEQAHDTSMDYGYLDDLSNPEDYLYNY